MKVYIRKVTLLDEEKVLDMFKEYENSELIPGIDRYEGIRNFERLSRMEFKKWLEELSEEEDATKLPETFSPQAVYIVLNEEEQIIGMLNLRWKEVPILLEFGGMIGYSIRPSQRGNGYSNYMLKEALKEYFKVTGKERILITCKGINIPSKKAIEKNGGVYESTYYNEIEGCNYLRYWIEKGRDTNEK